jgi:hypothetical protein
MTEVNFLVKKGLTVPKGSASTPSVIFDASDPNTGLYSPGADQVAVATNGTGRLFVDASGRVALGGTTVTDSNLLNIQGSTATDNVGVVLNKTNGTAQVWGIQNSGSLNFFNYTASSTALTINTSNQVGIGTSSVNALLEVNNSTAGGEVQRIEGNYDGSGSVILTNWRRAGGSVAAALKYNDDSSPLCMSIGTTTSHEFRIRTADTDAITIDTSQRVGIGTSSPATLLDLNSAAATNTTLAYSENGALKWYNRYNAGDGSFQIVDVVNTTTRLHISNTGNVGIGTTSPSASALLDVTSTTAGFLPPRMTTAQRDAISSPAAGLMVYNTSTNKLNFYNGTAWEAVTSA